MSDHSKIEWTDTTWNPLRGCIKISPGCKHCYAETFAERFRGVPGHPYEQGFDLRLVPGKLSEPFEWPRPRTVFVNSMSDLFQVDVPDSYIEDVVRVMVTANWHTYQVLTKRSERLQQMLTTKLAFAVGCRHIWWGVSVEDQRYGLPRVEHLRHAPAAVRFLSIEPLLEDLGPFDMTGIDWAIVGGESGWGARPLQPEWVDRIHDLCTEAGVAFFFKQWGGVHKSKSGRLLHGRTYDDMPQRLAMPMPDRKHRLELARRATLSHAHLQASALPLAALLLFSASGTAASPHKGTEILWDKFGVAHVYAKTVEDMFYCYGYAQAQSHGDLLLHLYGESRGRASEYFGASHLEDDKWVWTNSIPQRSAQWLAMQKPTFRSYMEAFAKGINDYATKHPEALSEESKRVLPITALDPIEHTHRIVHFTYMGSRRLAGPAAPVTEAGLLETPEDVGSNGWAIAPAHTAAGHTLLLGNPHLAWGGWQTYYEIQLTAPGIDLYGASQVGFPILRFMFSEYLGFNQTVNYLDTVDLYRIKTQGDGYLFEGAVNQYKKSNFTLKIRQPDGSLKPQTFETLSTVHGPVIRQQNGENIAMRVAALDRPFMLEEYWEMATAHNFAQFQKAVSRLQVPCFNILYGDRDGHIEYLFNGTAPRRTSGDLRFWAGIVPGDTSATLWKDYLSFEELPKSIDPPVGYVHNTNDPPWNTSWPNALDPDKYPTWLAPRTITFRAERSLRMLYEDPKITYENFIRYKHSTRAEMADRILPDLLKAAEEWGTPLAKQAAKVLSTWDRQAETASRGAVLFYEWAVQFMGPTLASQAGFAVAYDLKLPLTTPSGLKDPKMAAQQLDAAARKVVQLYGALDVPWGDVMRFQYAGLDLPGNGGFGNLGIFRVITFGDAHGSTRSQTHGETWISAVEFSHPMKVKVLMTYGNSSQLGSKHQADQLPLLANKELRTARRTRAAILANLESRDRF